jgi:hypothetical protein
MGYTRFSLKKIFLGAFWLFEAPDLGACARRHGKGHDCSWGKLKLLSVFLQ